MLRNEEWAECVASFDDLLRKMKTDFDVSYLRHLSTYYRSLQLFCEGMDILYKHVGISTDLHIETTFVPPPPGPVLSAKSGNGPSFSELSNRIKSPQRLVLWSKESKAARTLQFQPPTDDSEPDTSAKDADVEKGRKVCHSAVCRRTLAMHHCKAELVPFTDVC